MSIRRLAIPTAALFLATSFPACTAWGTPLPFPRLEGVQDRGDWAEAPREFNDIQRRGFRDGIEGAHRDMDNHRNPDPNNRDEYRNANFPPRLREQYRETFRRGYTLAISRMMGGPPPPMAGPVRPMPGPGPAGGWEPTPGRFSEIQRRGYQDGVDGAHRDLDNHRRPDPNNRDEYRDPHVPPPLVDDYREGFRRGYEETMAQLMGEAPRERWDVMPGRFSEIQHRGFQDGMDGARKDADNHRRPDPNNRDEYRNPNVPPQLQEEYREGFRRGYERAMAHLLGY